MTADRKFAVIDTSDDCENEFVEYCDSREEAIEKAKEAIARLTPQERRKREIYPAEIDADWNVWRIEEVA